jgi:hypothetical protein
VPTGCQAALDAVCNAPANAACVNTTAKISGQGALPLVGLYDAGLYKSPSGLHPSAAMWRCYGRTALDPTHKHWNKAAAIPLNCGQSNTALRDSLAAAFKATAACIPVVPGSVAYPADTWTQWNDVRPSDRTTSRRNKNLTSTVGSYYCTSYPNQYLDPIQHLVIQLNVGGVLAGNSSNITVEIRPIKPAGATYQLTAMLAPLNGPVRGIPFMLARENLSTTASHLGPQVVSTSAGMRPLVTEHEHNSAIFKA